MRVVITLARGMDALAPTDGGPSVLASGAEAPAERHLLRSNSLRPTGPVPGIGRLLTAAFAAGADPMHARCDDSSARRPRTNPILTWAMSQRRTAGELLAFLEASRRSLDESLGSGRGRGTLARALFLEYARGQGLSCGELAMLLGDAGAMAREALAAIEDRARRGARRPRWSQARRARSP